MNNSPTVFSYAYRELLRDILHHGVNETNARTGVEIRAYRGGYSFKVDLSDGLLPMPGNRRYWPRVAAAETAWQFMGTQDPEWIVAKAPKIWSAFVEDGKLETAYGYRWRQHFGRDQLEQAINQLLEEPTNRQLYISSWDPALDGLGSTNQPKNIPCPVGFSLTALEDKVHMSLFIRSSDVFVGLPYDVMGYALTLDAIAASVKRTPGTLHVTLAHAHYYKPHAGNVEDCIQGKHSDSWVTPKVSLPGWDVEEVQEEPDRYLSVVATLAKRSPNNEWDPAPVLVL